MWARYKASEGWNHYRLLLTSAGGVIGGFQLLWRRSRFGRLGYVSKGPVTHPESAATVGYLERRLRRAAQDLKLVALVCQFPDESGIEPGFVRETGFVESNPMGVIESTYLVDVGPPMDELRRNMSSSLRRNIRKARKLGLVVREGTEADLPRFFELMAATCRRQNTRPNPPNAESLRLLWRAFHPTGSIRLTLVDGDGISPAGKLALNFGDRVSVWKKGWDGSHVEWHANELLEEDALEWAHHHGYRVCDFCSIDRPAAEGILGGHAPARMQLTSRDEYHLRFGGYPKLLPRSRLFITNPVLRWGYHLGFGRLERFRRRIHKGMAS